MAGFGSIASTVNAGLIIHSDVCQSAPPYLRMRALKVRIYMIISHHIRIV
jgi:hypothetical protein